MKQVDELIRGEKAAVMSLDAVLKNISDTNEKQRLTSMKMDHEKAVGILSRYAGNENFKDSTNAGPWGAFMKAFAGGASFFGDKAALQALKVGEEHGIQEYKVALNDAAINMELKEVIRSELLPQQERHISVINSYLQ